MCLVLVRCRTQVEYFKIRYLFINYIVFTTIVIVIDLVSLDLRKAYVVKNESSTRGSTGTIRYEISQLLVKIRFVRFDQYT